MNTVALSCQLKLGELTGTWSATGVAAGSSYGENQNSWPKGFLASTERQLPARGAWCQDATFLFFK